MSQWHFDKNILFSNYLYGHLVSNLEFGFLDVYSQFKNKYTILCQSNH